MGTLLSFGRLFTDQAIVPLRLTLAGEPPSYHDRYAALFGCPALCGQPDDAIVFRRSDLALPLVSANPAVAALFEDAAERDLDARRALDDTVAAVRAALRQVLHGDPPSVRQVAGLLCLSERTLQRRLSNAGTPFSRLLDQVRLEMARRHLAADSASLTEIAYLLGFADPNSFFRSFKRWTGRTPADWRLGVRAAATSESRPASTGAGAAPTPYRTGSNNWDSTFHPGP
jgi:AraC-like DNA-binding protein